MNKKRLTVLLLVLTMLLSALSIGIGAAEPDPYRLTVELDLEDYAIPVEQNDYQLSGNLHVSGIPEAGTKSTLVFRRSLDTIAGVGLPNNIYFHLNSKVEAAYWLIDGKKVENGKRVRSDATEVTQEQLNDKTQNFLYIEISADQVRINYNIVTNNDEAVSSCESEVVKIKPVLVGADYTYKATTVCSPANAGTSACAPNKSVENSYILVANTADGWSFEKWTASNDTQTLSTSNVYETAALTDNTEFTAHFHEWYKPSIVCVDETGAELQNFNTTTVTRIENDTWRLSALGTKNGWVFDHWSKADSTEDLGTDYTLTQTVEKDTVYYAHYKPVYITGISSVSAYSNGNMSGTAGAGSSLTAGASVWVTVTYSANGSDLADSHIAVYQGGLDAVKAAVEAGTAKPMGALEVDGHLDNATARFLIEKWPADTDKVTAVAYTTGRETFYRELTVSTQAAGEQLGLTYLSMPKNSSIAGGLLAGPYIFDVAAYVNEETGGMELYAAGVGGVYQFTSNGATDMVQMKGMEELKTSGNSLNDTAAAYAVGRTSDGGLMALVYAVDDTQINGVQYDRHYELRYYDPEEGSWAKITGSEIDPKSVSLVLVSYSANTALVMDSDDVWAKSKHWSGNEWVDISTLGIRNPNRRNNLVKSFDNYFKVNDKVAYATSGVFTFRYDLTAADPKWVCLGKNIPQANSRLVGVAPDETLLFSKTTNNSYYTATLENGAYTCSDVISAIPADVLGDIWTTDGAVKPAFIDVVDAGIGSDGKVYAVVNGSGSTRAYIVRYDGSAWTLLDTADAFDIGGAAGSEARPTAITTAATPADGITVYFGSDGSFYLQTESHTVTFHSNGGTDVAPVTGPAWSTITVPQPTKTGYTFAGWYTDEDCTTLWESPVIPNADLHVYAKWTSAEDPYAKDRQMALEQLDAALARLDQNDYSAANWQKVLTEYKNGKYRIIIAEPKPAGSSQAEIDKAVQDTIYAALNNAIDRMSAVPTMTVKDITVAVSMDADTLGLGYLIKPTLVTVPKYTQASKVITDLIVEQNKDSNELLHTGKQDKGNDGEKLTAPYYDYLTQGTVEDSFYLAHVYYPQQTEAHVADYITAKTGQIVYDKYKNGHYLGEFDYYNMSGWMYSIADKTTGGQSFPGVGAAGWRMRDGEVMRWQFTVYGYGADLNADNSMYGTASITGEIGDKTQLTYKVAEMREQYKDASEDKTYTSGDNTLESSRIYTNVLEGILGNPQAKQDALDTAMEDLELVATELENRDIFAGIADAVDADSMSAALNAYNQLTEQAKKAFDKAYPEQAEKIHAAMAASDREAAQAVIDKITALGDPDKVTLEQEEAVKAAREAYDALTDAQKEIVGEENLAKLEKAEARIEDLKKPTPPTPVTPSKPTTPSKPKDDKPTTGSSFTDVPAGSWYEDAVNYVSEKGLMNGTSKNGFSPNATTTRGMIVTILARVEGINTNGTPWYAAGQKWAMDNGISDGTNMIGEVTREQLAAILYRYAKQKGYDVSKSAALTGFSDADKVSGYAAEAMQWAVAEGLLQGSNGKLNPQGSATRAQVATILMRFMEKIAK